MNFWVAAKILAAFHLLIAAFNFLGWVAIVAGALAGARFVRCLWFRAAHLGSFSLVVLFALLGRHCPLTAWEYELMQRAGARPTEHEPFLARLVSACLYPNVKPELLFWLTFLLGISTLALWRLVPPRSRR